MNQNCTELGRSKSTAIILLVLLALLGSWACGSSEAEPSGPAALGGGGTGGAVGGSGGEGGVVSLPTEADQARLNHIIELLSADEMAGRLTGIGSGDDAEQAVYDFLEATGIEMATQQVEFPLFEVGTPAELALVDELDQTLETFAYIDDYRDVWFSGSGQVTGDLVFAGYGIVLGDYDSYEGIDVQGKIALILTDVPSGQGMDPYDDGRLDQKVNWAWERGAIGVIFVPAHGDATYDSQRPWESIFTAVDKYGDFHSSLYHAEVPVAFVHVGSTPALVGETATDLANNPAGYDTGLRVRLEINGTVHETATCQNVFGIMRGEDPTLQNEVLILGAHYDHLGVGADERIFNGAGDNATGTGIVLETAATLMASGAGPRRTILFALWCAEETGYWGSLEYGHYGTPVFPLSATQLMIQVDYIGEQDGPYLTNLDDYPLVNQFLGESVHDAELPVEGLNWGGDCASDDCIFLMKGVPAYRFIAYGDYHHKAEDDFENLNLDMVKRVADVCIQGLGAIAF